MESVVFHNIKLDLFLPSNLCSGHSIASRAFDRVPWLITGTVSGGAVPRQPRQPQLGRGDMPSQWMRLVNSEPVDNTARLIAIPSENYRMQPDEIGRKKSKNPLPTRKCDPWLVDHTGKVIDRLRVVGLSADRTNVRWVVRCVCGFYQLRRARVIAKPTKKEMMCDECRRLEELKAGRYKDSPLRGSELLG